MSLYTNGEVVGTSVEEIDKLWTAFTILVSIMVDKGILTHEEFLDECTEEVETGELQKEFPFMKE